MVMLLWYRQNQSMKKKWMQHYLLNMDDLVEYMVKQLNKATMILAMKKSWTMTYRPSMTAATDLMWNFICNLIQNVRDHPTCKIKDATLYLFVSEASVELVTCLI